MPCRSAWCFPGTRRGAARLGAGEAHVGRRLGAAAGHAWPTNYSRGLDVARQVPLPVIYRGQRIDCAFRADLIVDGSLLVEVKSVHTLAPIHIAQGLTYLRLGGLKEGLLINFNERLLKDGIRSLLL